GALGTSQREEGAASGVSGGRRSGGGASLGRVLQQLPELFQGADGVPGGGGDFLAVGVGVVHESDEFLDLGDGGGGVGGNGLELLEAQARGHGVVGGGLAGELL